MEPNKPVIVAVDDQPVILHTVASELRELYQVRPFTSGQTALKYLDSHSADLILLDYSMPDMNGCQVMERLQEDKRFSSVPIVFLTGTEGEDVEVELLEKGASDYIQKPIKSRVLQTRVRLQLELARYRSHMEALVSERTAELLQVNKELKTREEITLNLLAEATDLRDHDTGGHIRRTTEMVRLMVEELLRNPRAEYELTAEEAEDIQKSAKLHDLGKIAMPDRILLKPGKLDEEEFAVIKGHPALGATLLEKYITQIGGDPTLNTARDISLCHHEKWNGQGYPGGQAGSNIPLSARITAIADVYDALTSARPYKNPFPHEKAVEIITAESGAHFDPYLVTIFLKLEDSFRGIMAANSEQ